MILDKIDEIIKKQTDVMQQIRDGVDSKMEPDIKYIESECNRNVNNIKNNYKMKMEKNWDECVLETSREIKKLLSENRKSRTKIFHETAGRAISAVLADKGELSETKECPLILA